MSHKLQNNIKRQPTRNCPFVVGSFSIASKVVFRFGLAAVLLLGVLTAPCAAQWTWSRTGGSHNWGSGGSWSGASGSPNSLTAIANVNNNITSNQTINLNNSVSAGTINIGDSTLTGGVFQTFTIQPASPTQTLTLGSGGINSSNSLNTITANMILGASTVIQHTTASGSLNLNGNVNLGSNALTVSGSGSTTIAGLISGTGSLVKTGSSNLILSGANNYSGGTTASAGTLTGSSTSLQGAIINNSSVVFNQAAAGTYAGAMSGTGSFVKTGVGNLTLSGVNSYGGGTTVSAGILTGSSTSLQGAIVNNSSVVFNQSTNGTYAGVIGGSGSLSKSGSGTVTFSNSQSYLGDTSITGGTLRLNSGVSLASSLIQIDSGGVLDVSQVSLFNLNAGQTLSGSGQVIGAVTQSAGSMISPGSSPGTLNFTGDVTLMGGSSYLWEINDATGTSGNTVGWDLLTTSGSLIIGSTSSNPYVISVQSLLPSNAPGDVGNFDPNGTYDWEIAFAAAGISSFDASAFTVDTSGFSNDLSSVPNHTFAIWQNGNSLYLNYAAVPEPSTFYAIALFTLGVALMRQPRSRRKS